VEEEGGFASVKLAKQDTLIRNVQFRFPVSSFIISKSDFYCKKIVFFTSRILNNL
jgi:hypothetical protein